MEPKNGLDNSLKAETETVQFDHCDLYHTNHHIFTRRSVAGCGLAHEYLFRRPNQSQLA